jgi:hypothetical protein
MLWRIALEEIQAEEDAYSIKVIKYAIMMLIAEEVHAISNEETLQAFGESAKDRIIEGIMQS